MTGEGNELLAKPFRFVSLLFLAIETPHKFYHCMYYWNPQIKATFVYRLSVVTFKCGAWTSSRQNHYCQGEVPYEFCAYAYRTEPVTSHKRRWWVINVPCRTERFNLPCPSMLQKPGCWRPCKTHHVKLSVQFQVQEQMFLFTIFLTPWSAAGTAQYPAVFVWNEMLNICKDIPAES